MTERMIVNRVRKLKELEAQQKEIEEQIEALKAEIKADMQRKDLEEQKAGDYTVRFTTVSQTDSMVKHSKRITQSCMTST